MDTVSRPLIDQAEMAGYAYASVVYWKTLPKDVGEGYRLLRVGETVPKTAQVWSGNE